MKARCWAALPRQRTNHVHQPREEKSDPSEGGGRKKCLVSGKPRDPKKKKELFPGKRST